jgi:hypothetical protein
MAFSLNPNEARTALMIAAPIHVPSSNDSYSAKRCSMYQFCDRIAIGSMITIGNAVSLIPPRNQHCFSQF